MTDRDAIFGGILREPDRDDLRGAWADCIEAEAVGVACGTCDGRGRSESGFFGAFGPFDDHKCPKCSGTGRVWPDAERAEFVRVGCELARLSQPTVIDAMKRCGGDISRAVKTLTDMLMEFLARRDSLRAHSAALLARGRGFGWFDIDGCDTRLDCHSDTGTAYWIRGVSGGEVRPMVSGTVRRGFVESVSMPWAAFFVEGVTRAIFSTFPIERVTLSDAVVHDSGGNETCYIGGLGRFPKEYWRRLDNHRTRSSALAALSSVCVDYGRSLAGLAHASATPA